MIFVLIIKKCKCDLISITKKDVIDGNRTRAVWWQANILNHKISPDDVFVRVYIHVSLYIHVAQPNVKKTESL